MHIAELDAQKQANGLNVRFSVRPVKDAAESIKAGHPKFREVEYVEIKVPGDRDSVERPVRDEDRQRFAGAYAAFKANTAGGGLVGMPLTEWPSISASQVKELEHFNIRTVEQLAAVTDANMSNVGPYIELRRKAKAFLDAAAGLAPLEKVTAENAALKGELEVLKKQVAEMVAAQSKSKK